MKFTSRLLCLSLSAYILLSLTNLANSHMNEAEIRAEVNKKVITYGSILRMQNYLSKFQ